MKLFITNLHLRSKAFGLAIFLGTTAASGMTFELRSQGGNCNGCEWVAAEGEITADTPEKFEAFVAQQDRNGSGYVKFELNFNSPGGSLAAGMRLGEAIRKHQYRTAVAATVPYSGTAYQRLPGQCASACAFAFLGWRHKDCKTG